MPTATLEPIVANEKERLALREMEEGLNGSLPNTSLPQLVGLNGKTYSVPMPIVQLIQQALSYMVHGNGVTLTPHSQPSETRAAADQPSIPKSEAIEALAWIEETTGFSQERVGELLGITGKTISEWKQASAPISDELCSRLFTIREILETAWEENYPTKAAIASWLDTPRHLGELTPAQLLAANEMGKARYQAIATPLPPHARSRPLPKPLPEERRPWEEPLRPWPDPDEELERWMKENNYSFDDYKDPD